MQYKWSRKKRVLQLEEEVEKSGGGHEQECGFFTQTTSPYPGESIPWENQVSRADIGHMFSEVAQEGAPGDANAWLGHLVSCFSMSRNGVL